MIQQTSYIENKDGTVEAKYKFSSIKDYEAFDVLIMKINKALGDDEE